MFTEILSPCSRSLKAPQYKVKSTQSGGASPCSGHTQITVTCEPPVAKGCTRRAAQPIREPAYSFQRAVQPIREPAHSLRLQPCSAQTSQQPVNVTAIQILQPNYFGASESYLTLPFNLVSHVLFYFSLFLFSI